MRRALPPERFAAALERLPRDELGRFVAAVWDARGWATRWESASGTVTATRPDEASMRLFVAGTRRGWRPGSSPTPPSDADVTVLVGRSRLPWGPSSAAGAGSEREVIDAAELRRIVFYALDPETAESLCREHLDVDPWEDPAPADTGVDPWQLSARGQIVAVGLILLVITAPVIGLPVLTGDRPAADPIDDAGSPAAGSVATRTEGAPATATTVTATDDGVEVAASAGRLRSDELTQAEALIAAHSRLLGRPYEWTIRYWAFRNGSRIANYTEVVRVERWDMYYAETDRPANATLGWWTFNPGDLYADGRRWYLRERVNGSVDYRSGRIERRYRTAPLVVRAQTYIEIFLRNASVVSVRDEEDTTLYLLRARSDPVYANVDNVTATAWVSSTRGVIALNATFENPRNDADRIVFQYRYRFVNVSVTPPEWYGAARNATD